MPTIASPDLEYLTTVDRLTSLLLSLKPNSRKQRRLADLIKEYQHLNDIANGSTPDEATRLRSINRMAEIELYPKKPAPPKSVVKVEQLDWECDTPTPLENYLEGIQDLIDLYGPAAKLVFDAGHNNVTAVVQYTEGTNG